MIKANKWFYINKFMTQDTVSISISLKSLSKNPLKKTS